MAKKSKPTPENEPLLERGHKQRAGRVLSEYLRAVAQEITEVVPDDRPNPGPPKLMSKAERLARWLWQKALPHKGNDGEIVEPNLDVVKLVLDRVEGKPGIQGEEKESERETVPQKISRMNVDRLNAMAEELNGSV